MTLVVDCKDTGCFSCYVEKGVINGWGLITLVVDCKHTGCFSC